MCLRSAKLFGRNGFVYVFGKTVLFNDRLMGINESAVSEELRVVLGVMTQVGE